MRYFKKDAHLPSTRKGDGVDQDLTLFSGSRGPLYRFEPASPHKSFAEEYLTKWGQMRVLWASIARRGQLRQHNIDQTIETLSCVTAAINLTYRSSMTSFNHSDVEFSRRFWTDFSRRVLEASRVSSSIRFEPQSLSTDADPSKPAEPIFRQ